MPDPTLSDLRHHSSTTPSDSDKAWNLLSILFTLRRPATPEELASLCPLFHATPELVLRLCSIPNSPIFSTEEDHRLVTVAVAALSALEEFAPESRRVMELFMLTTYYPKTEFRKRKAELDSEALPFAKRRLQFRNEDGEGDEILACHRNLLIEGNERNEKGLGPLLLDFNAELADLQMTLYEHEEEGDAAVWMSALMHEESPRLLDTHNVPKPIMVDRGDGCFFDLNLPPSSSNQDALVEKANAFDKEPTRCVDSGSIVNVVALEKVRDMKKAETNTDFLSAECPSPEKQPVNSSGKLKAVCTNLLSQKRVLVESLEDNEVVNTPKQQFQCKSGQRTLSVENKLKNNNTHSVHRKENMVDSAFITPKLERIKLPHFEDFIIEDEEGSGGYGTVYRAKRKNDGKRFAIKCPHDKAHKHHVDNERKMLERFGGRSFIIKYKGSFRRGDSDCFILEHVVHDRPEVLKKKIGLYELQWYGYCMFRALACMHKQGVVHRDVKPGNFLYSRKLSKGYLIDFNLALDLQQKYAIIYKSKLNRHESFGHVPLPQGKSALPNRGKKLLRSDLVDSKTPVDHNRNVRKRAQVGHSNKDPKMTVGNKCKNQCGDGSGITSTKDVTDMIPSAERVREPLPCLGRKELISLAQDAILSPNHEVPNSPASKRKRIAASPGKVDSKLIYTTPMSLNFTGAAVSSASLLKSKVVLGDGKQKREGPCAGTKGFRAPEVLFRSLHQGPKVDVWSAGVTLLYLMIGRSPFTGDPEQNIKDIAKLKGSEDLWEVAKLHDRESTFPVELFDVKSLPSMKLQSWCKAHTKRPEFFNFIPRSLFDLVDKCLTANPRLRISAEEALRHEFFAPCHESLMKHRMSRQDSMAAQKDLV